MRLGFHRMDAATSGAACLGDDALRVSQGFPRMDAADKVGAARLRVRPLPSGVPGLQLAAVSVRSRGQACAVAKHFPVRFGRARRLGDAKYSVHHGNGGVIVRFWLMLGVGGRLIVTGGLKVAC